MDRIPVPPPSTPAPRFDEEPGGVATLVAVTYHAQRMDGWCWAAALQMAIESVTGNNIAQCTLANLEFQRDDCCPTNPACDMGAPLTSFAGILLTWGLDSDLIDRPLFFDDVLAQVNAGKPIIYNITFSEGTLHTGVIANAGYAPNGEEYVYFLDPDQDFFNQWGRAPYGWVPYAWVLNGYGLGGNWTDTVFNIGF